MLIWMYEYRLVCIFIYEIKYKKKEEAIDKTLVHFMAEIRCLTILEHNISKFNVH